MAGEYGLTGAPSISGGEQFDPIRKNGPHEAGRTCTCKEGDNYCTLGALTVTGSTTSSSSESGCMPTISDS